jgi:3-phenylpropionate/trans-cinnamate dioxygenase ferredoxin subunit
LSHNEKANKLTIAPGFVKVAEKSEIPIGTMKKVSLNGKEILVANVDGNFYAIGGKCTHMGGDLSKGVLDGNIVKCPRHGSRFDVTTGRNISGPKILFLAPKVNNEPLFPVKVEGNDVLINLG